MEKYNYTVRYNYLVQLDKLKNFSCILNNGNKDIQDSNARFIYDNYDKLDELGRRKLLMKCLGDNEVNMHLLRYEFFNYQPNKENINLTLEEFEKKATKIIERYHWKAGGYKIEDSEWIIHKPTSKLYEILPNELLFENTLDRSDIDDEETESYMNRLMEHLNSLSKNIEVEYRYKNKQNKVIRLLIWCTDTNMKVDSDSEEVGL